MDRMIWLAWRAFWVGLGASAVLIAQSVSAPAPSGGVPPVDPTVVPAPLPGPPAAARSPETKSADPILSRSTYSPAQVKVKLLPLRRPRA